MDDNLKVRPLTDDEADAATGGELFNGFIMTRAEKEHIKTLAFAEGRTHRMVNMDSLCLHNNDYKWARDKKDYYDKTWDGSGYMTIFYDVKCYKCKQIWQEYDAGKY